jgi:hypothetical protein
MLFDRQIQILVAEKQFVLYNIYKTNFARISPGIVIKGAVIINAGGGGGDISKLMVNFS